MNIQTESLFLPLWVEANYTPFDGIVFDDMAKLSDEEFDGLRSELLDIAEKYPHSDVSNPGHGTNWTGMHGTIYQWSLLNINASTNEPHDTNSLGVYPNKRFFLTQYPTLNKLYTSLKDVMVTCRLNYLGPNSWLEPHKEWTVHKDSRGVFARMRFHIPIETNYGCTSQLNKWLVHMPCGYVYSFNNGAIHDSRNMGETGRYHLVFDCLFTKNLFSLLKNHFGELNNGFIDFIDFIDDIEIPNTYPCDYNEVTMEESYSCKLL